MTVLVLTCKDCALYGDLDFIAASPRALFFHLLWHRDSGHVVDQRLLAELDPEQPDIMPGRGAPAGYEKAINSYSDNPDDRHVTPERMGRVRGHVRLDP